MKYWKFRKRTKGDESLNSKGTTGDYDSDFSDLKKLDALLDPDWDEDSNVTVNIHPHKSTSSAPSSLTTNKKVSIIGAIIMALAAIGKVIQELGWLN